MGQSLARAKCASSARNGHNIISTDMIMWRRQYREFVRGMSRTRDAMRGALDRRVIYGGEAFTGELTKKYEIQEVIKPKGRPKKRDGM